MKNFRSFRDKFSILGCILVALISCQTPTERRYAEHPKRSSALMLNNSQIRLANIATQNVSENEIGQTIAVNASLSVDEEQSSVIASRVAGRIEKLYAKETGKMVKQGEPLYVLYSEMLVTLQQEYLLAKEQYESVGKTEARYEAFYKASEQKLLLYGLSARQIGQLAISKSVQPGVSFLAPASGIITEINVSEGNYIPEGALLYKIEDTRTLWVEAELYPEESSFVKKGDNVQVIVTGFESEPLEANVTFLSPEYRSNTQLISFRAEIKNKDMRFSPGMQAQVLFKHSAKRSLTIPVDAVIRDDKGTYAYVQRGKNTFEERLIKTGLEDFYQVEILEGLTAGDTIAIRGAYLLHSEFILNKEQ